MEGPATVERSRDSQSQLRDAANPTVARGKQKLVLTLFAFVALGPIWVWPLVLLMAATLPYVLTILICYTVYIVTIGFRPTECMSWKKQRSGIWRHMQEYFPAKLHKLADLDPKRTYIFTLVPHGIISLSSWLHFSVDATDFSQLFPGIEIRTLTLRHYFLTPFVREYCLLNGLRHASRGGIKSILGSGPGSAVLLVPGGAAEALLAAPGIMDLVIAKRKGFVRLAIETGSSLVPVMAFGENEAFDTYIPARGSWGEKILHLLKKNFGFSTPLFQGVGFTEGSWGILPKAVPLNTVVGAPIEVPQYHAESKHDEKMLSLVDEYHAKFLTEVQKLWDDHKDKYAAGRKGELYFVE